MQRALPFSGWDDQIKEFFEEKEEMPSYEDSGWKNYRKDDRDPYEHDDWDFAEQIRSTVASSTDWINDMIASVRGEVTGQADSVRRSAGVKSPEELREEAERRAMRQKELQEQTRKREEIKSRIGSVPSWKGLGHGFAQGITAMFTVIFGVITLSSFFDTAVSGFDIPDVVGTIICMIITLGFYKVSSYNLRKRRQLKRFVRYTQMIKDKLYVNIDDFVSSLGYSKKTVLKDLRQMIEMGILKQGHIDQDDKYLMLTDETYNQYLQAQQSYKSRMMREGTFETAGMQQAEQELEQLKRKQQQRAAEQAEQKAQEEEILSGIEARKKEELTKTLTQGRAYIKQIREANDEIPGEEISAKLDRLETVAGQVFTIVEEHPEKLSEIHKFMEYYLPTTLKLVKSYHEFDMQPVQGENITKAKKEIEDTLDMINMAFENLSDRLYQDVAMEVSADISVLQTLLAQEGLKKKDFVIK
jgi:5-bromo-4-chloroindolyl phosphate hydrolysis protein